MHLLSQTVLEGRMIVWHDEKGTQGKEGWKPVTCIGVLLCARTGVLSWRRWRSASWCWRRSVMHRCKWLPRRVRVSLPATRRRSPSRLWCTIKLLYCRKHCSVCRIQTLISSWGLLPHDSDRSLQDRLLLSSLHILFVGFICLLEEKISFVWDRNLL